MRGDDNGNGDGFGGAGDSFFPGDGWGCFHLSSGDGFCAQESVWDDYVWVRTLVSPLQQRVWVVSGDGRPAFVLSDGDGPGAWS